MKKRRVLGVRDVQPTLVSANASMHTVLDFFLHFFPMEFFKTTILQATSKKLFDPLVTWDEFLCFISIFALCDYSESAAANVLVKRPARHLF